MASRAKFSKKVNLSKKRGSHTRPSRRIRYTESERRRARMGAEDRKKAFRALCLLALLCALTAPFLGREGAAASDEETRRELARRANVPEGMWIWIDIPQKSLTLYEGTRVVKRYAVATGAGETPTPIGSFWITSRFAGDLGGFGTRFLGLNVPWGQYGVHGTNRPESIGSNASHGCIRMHVRDSEELYGLTPNWTRVVIQGGPYGQLDNSLRPLGPGDRNSHVAAVQRRLNVLGYYAGVADGIYGQGTAAAVKRARKALGLPEGDRVDVSFYQAIGLVLFE